MVDDWLGPIDVMGRWVGFYRSCPEPLGTFPITAEICQEGDRITGEMSDPVTDRSISLERVFAGHREQIAPWDRPGIVAGTDDSFSIIDRLLVTEIAVSPSQTVWA